MVALLCLQERLGGLGVPCYALRYPMAALLCFEECYGCIAVPCSAIGILGSDPSPIYCEMVK